MGQSGFHGIYTPITLQLWGQRLSRERQAPADAQDAAPQPKAPKTLTIHYPFTSDDALKEKVQLCAGHAAVCAACVTPL